LFFPSSSFSCVRFGLSVLVPARVRSFFWHGLLHRRRQSFQGLSPYEGRAFRGGDFNNATAFFPFEVRFIGVWGDTLSVAEVVVLCRTCVRRGCLQKQKKIKNLRLCTHCPHMKPPLGNFVYPGTVSALIFSQAQVCSRLSFRAPLNQSPLWFCATRCCLFPSSL